jgi:hypothetical protein
LFAAAQAAKSNATSPKARRSSSPKNERYISTTGSRVFTEKEKSGHTKKRKRYVRIDCKLKMVSDILLEINPKYSANETGTGLN